jgi:phage FluMu gp28-like protein
MSDPLDHFLPYQRRWFYADAPVVVGEKSRRIGWTYASACRAVWRRLTVGSDLFYSSADLSAAREFVEYCKYFAKGFEAGCEDEGERVIDEQAGITALVLRFSHGARIVAGSSSPKFFRSKGGDADADEFAFHAAPRELFKAMHATAMVWGHRLRLWSTHNGEGSFFNLLVKGARREATERERGREGEGEAEGAPAAPVSPSTSLPLSRSPRMLVQRVTLPDAVEQGLVEAIKGLKTPNPTARREWLEEMRASCPDEDTWNEEYLCRPSSEQASLLSYALIGACEEGEVPILDWHGDGARSSESIQNQQSTIQNPVPLFAGFDVGRKRDRSVLWVLERVGDVYWTREVRVLEDVNFTAQEDMLHALMAGRRVKRLCVDSTGIGAMLAERLAHRWGHRAEAVHFTAAVKSELAMPLVRLFQDRLVRVPADPVVREDLHKVRKTVTAAGNVRLDASRDDQTGHADRFWALALAYHAADDRRTGRGVLPSVMSKPAGW